MYAATSGYLDDIPLEQVARYEHDLYRHFASEQEPLLSELRDTEEMSDALKIKFDAALSEFGQTFKEGL